MREVLQRDRQPVGLNPELKDSVGPLLTVSSTPGKALEERLNKEYGPGNPLYEEMCDCVRQGLVEGWVADIE
jgi:hypothetical protein